MYVRNVVYLYYMPGLVYAVNTSVSATFWAVCVCILGCLCMVVCVGVKLL